MKTQMMAEASALARQFRAQMGLNDSEPIDVTKILTKENILTLFRPLSDTMYGLSLRSIDKAQKFILVNSESTMARQNFTIAHELYHLYFDESPEQHVNRKEDEGSKSERVANMFAAALLMPESGLLKMIPSEEARKRRISIDTALMMEQYFGVSHKALIIQLKDLNIIGSTCYDELIDRSVKELAKQKAMPLDIYCKAREGVVYGDYMTLAARLYDEEKISEGHYLELTNLIDDGREEG